MSVWDWVQTELSKANKAGRQERENLLLELIGANIDEFREIGKKPAPAADRRNCTTGEIGGVLLELRQTARLTQIEVAHLIDRYTGSTISHYERGLRDITLKKLEEVTGVLGWDVEIVLSKQVTTAVSIE